MVTKKIETGVGNLKVLNRQNIKHMYGILLVIFIIQTIILVTIGLLASETSKTANLNKKSKRRSPANFIPSENIDTVSLENDEPWIETVVVEDNAGILKAMKETVGNWEHNEEYIILWNQEDSGLVDIPTDSAKKNYITKQFLKYLDKRLAGEIKHAEKGTTFHKIGKVHKALRPNTKVQISSNVKLRFKARVLQGKGIIILENPYVECNSNFNFKGHANVNLSKQFKKPGINTAIHYSINDEKWVASVSKSITSKISSKISSEQNTNENPTDKNADKRFEVLFVHNF